MRRWMLAFAIINVVGAVVVPLVFGIEDGVSRTMTFSKYRELEQAGLVNVDAVKAHHGGWKDGDVGGWLANVGGTSPVASRVACGLFAGNAIVFFELWRRAKNSGMLGAGGVVGVING